MKSKTSKREAHLSAFNRSHAQQQCLISINHVNMAKIYGDDAAYHTEFVIKRRKSAASEEPGIETVMKSVLQVASNLDVASEEPGPRPGSKKITEADIDGCREILWKLCEKQAQDREGNDEMEDMHCEDVVLATDVSTEEFERAALMYPRKMRGFNLKDGRVYIKEMGLGEHQNGISYFGKIIQNALLDIGGRSALDALKCMSDLTIPMKRDRCEPDYCLCPKNFSRDSHPTLVLEVAFRNESYPRLMGELKYWLTHNDDDAIESNVTERNKIKNTRIQIAIGLKIYEERVDGTRQVRLVYMDRSCVENPLVFELGSYVPKEIRTKWVSEPQATTLELKLSLLFHGTTIPACFGDHANLTLDLAAFEESLADL